MGWMSLWGRLKRMVSRASARLAQHWAGLRQRLRVARAWYWDWRQQHRIAVERAWLPTLGLASAIGIPRVQALLEAKYATDAQLAPLRALLLTLGGALFGATAIVSSLALFAMQTNIERMPHGLFVRLSRDRLLLGAFAAACSLAVAIASLSLMLSAELIGVAVFFAFWGMIAILSLFLFSYQRALQLVNPLKQLSLVTQQAQRELRRWGRRANTLIENADRGQQLKAEVGGSQADPARIAYFQLNPGWTQEASLGIRYAVSLGRHHAEQGDYDVSAQAMRTIVEINQAYIEAKGRSFVAEDCVFENPLARDGFIIGTLEHLRQTARAGVARRDEQQIEQALKAMGGLTKVYLRIDYASPHSSKSHAHLAVGYLAGEVERVAPHGMPDVLMNGLRLMGSCGVSLLLFEGPQGIATIVEKIVVISCARSDREDSHPVLLTGVEQLSRLSLGLLRTRMPGVRFAAERIRSGMQLLVRSAMTLPDAPGMSVHSRCLASYYSAATASSFLSRLVQLGEFICRAPAGDQDARQMADNVAEWADGIYQSEKELLLYAIEKRSHFTVDMIQWIAEVSTTLLRISTSVACSGHSRDKLREQARWLVSVLSWVPGDSEAVWLVESSRMTETLFEAAAIAQRLGCPEHAGNVCGLLLSWAFKGGRHEMGWGILERSVYGLATLVLLADDGTRVVELKEQVAAKAMAGELPSDVVRDRAALEIRTRAASLDQQGHWLSPIEREMAGVDREGLRVLLEEIADLISPDTKGEISVSRPF